MFSNYTLKLVELVRREALRARQTYWFKPELRDLPILTNVNVRWFAPLVAVEEEAIWSDSRDIRHRNIVACCRHPGGERKLGRVLREDSGEQLFPRSTNMKLDVIA